MVGKERAIRLAVSVAVAAVLSGGSAWALSGGLEGHPSGTASSSPTTAVGQCKPGWGYGDENHCHLGPPGLATSTSTSSTSTSSTSTSSTSTSSTSTSSTSTSSTSTTSTTSTTVPCKPGWGYGDKNHCHSGPPGLNSTHHNNGHSHGHGNN
jgi:hypothetical protein